MRAHRIWAVAKQMKPNLITFMKFPRSVSNMIPVTVLSGTAIISRLSCLLSCEGCLQDTGFPGIPLIDYAFMPIKCR